MHLNLPGSPNGAFFDQGSVPDAIITGRRSLPWKPDIHFVGFVDMSGGSSDDAVLSIAHRENGRTIIDLVVAQDGGTPFNPRINAVRKFVGLLKQYGIATVTGGNYAGMTFKYDFEACQIVYKKRSSMSSLNQPSTLVRSSFPTSRSFKSNC